MLLFEPVAFLTASTASARLWSKKLPLEFGKFGLQLAQVVAGSLVLLGLGHLGLDVFDLWVQKRVSKDARVPKRTTCTLSTVVAMLGWLLQVNTTTLVYEGCEKYLEKYVQEECGVFNVIIAAAKSPTRPWSRISRIPTLL